MAMENTKQALALFSKNKVKIDRPLDYFAETFKSDEKMDKIKSSLVSSQVKLQNLEERLLKKETSKMHKKIKHLKELEKSKEKKQNLSAIEEWKKNLSDNNSEKKDLSYFIKKQKSKGEIKGRFNRDISREKSANSKSNSKFVNLKSKKIKKGKRLGKAIRNKIKGKKGIKK